MVPGLAGKLSAQFGPAIDHGEHVGREKFGYRQGQGGRRARRDFGGLEHRAVACRKHAGQRREQSKQRRIPGADDAHHALGLVFDPGGGAEVVKGCDAGARRIGQPVLQVVAGVFERGERTDHVVHHGKNHRAAAKVFAHGLA